MVVLCSLDDVPAAGAVSLELSLDELLVWVLVVVLEELPPGCTTTGAAEPGTGTACSITVVFVLGAGAGAPGALTTVVVGVVAFNELPLRQAMKTEQNMIVTGGLMFLRVLRECCDH